MTREEVNTVSNSKKMDVDHGKVEGSTGRRMVGRGNHEAGENGRIGRMTNYSSQTGAVVETSACRGEEGEAGAPSEGPSS